MQPGRTILWLAAVFLVPVARGAAQPQGFNYDEAQVPDYLLPDPLVGADGVRVTTAADWIQRRRPAILALFARHVYGRTPKQEVRLVAEVLSIKKDALRGRARRKMVRLRFAGKPDGPTLDVSIYLPRKATGPVPAFLGLNFYGNHAVTAEADIPLSRKWMRSDRQGRVVDHRATETSRGMNASRWPVEAIVSRGYAVATMYCGDVDPDFDDQFRNGIHPLFRPHPESLPAAEAWGTIGAWAWGLSRVLDYFQSDEAIDATRVAVIGHSRLGKTALWAGAQDERFALVISNNSGCGGAALSRRRFGETVKRINTSFPHWFCGNFKRYNDNEEALPVDQHMLVALVAPRPVYIASAQEDRWADPKGEFLAARGASPVYKLLGTEGLPVEQMPPVGKPVMGRVGYHIRAGKHDVTLYDWQCYLDFADKHLGHER